MLTILPSIVNKLCGKQSILSYAPEHMQVCYIFENNATNFYSFIFESVLFNGTLT